MFRVAIIGINDAQLSHISSMIKTQAESAQTQLFKRTRDAFDELLTQPKDQHLIIIDLHDYKDIETELAVSRLVSTFPKTKILVLMPERKDDGYTPVYGGSRYRGANLYTLDKPLKNNALENKISYYLSLFDVEAEEYLYANTSILQPLYKSETARLRNKKVSGDS